MTLFATTSWVDREDGDATILLGATHAQTSWRNDEAHTTAAISLMKAHVSSVQQTYGRSLHAVLIAGDTWPKTCNWLGLRAFVEAPVPANRLHNDKVVFFGRGKDDYICGDGFNRTMRLVERPVVLKAAGTVQRQSGIREFVLCDHVFVKLTVAIEKQWDLRTRHQAKKPI